LGYISFFIIITTKQTQYNFIIFNHFKCTIQWHQVQLHHCITVTTIRLQNLPSFQIENLYSSIISWYSQWDYFPCPPWVRRGKPGEWIISFLSCLNDSKVRWLRWMELKGIWKICNLLRVWFRIEPRVKARSQKVVEFFVYCLQGFWISCIWMLLGNWGLWKRRLVRMRSQE
jgi:hypothetical protein